MSEWRDVPHSDTFADYFCLEAEPEVFSDWADRLPLSLGRFGVVYAVEVAAGIKIGKAGGGSRSTVFDQLSSRLTSYRSISPINVLGLRAVPRKRLLQEEAKLHHRLHNYRVEKAGRELFVDGPAVRKVLLETMWSDWHTDFLGLDARSELFREMQAADNGANVYTFVSEFEPSEELFDGFPKWEASGGWFSPYFGWDTWLKLHPEMELLSYLRCGDLHEEWERYADEKGWLPETFDENDGDDLGLLVLEKLLPAAESPYARLRARFDRWAAGELDHGFQPWWDSALERAGLQVVAVA